MHRFKLKLRQKANNLAARSMRRVNKIHDWNANLLIKTEDMETAQRRARESRWYADRGDQTLRVQYPLDQNSIVFDIGGYHGTWSRDIYCLYGSKIYIFEPVKSFVEIIKQTFGDNSDITVLTAGLSDKNQTTRIYVDEGASSTIKHAGKPTTIKLIKASDFLKMNGVKHVDLMKINIEGGEYALLNHLYEIDFIKNIRDIQVQFHDFTPTAEQDMKAIQKKLSETHKLTYQYPWVWDNWTRKK